MMTARTNEDFLLMNKLPSFRRMGTITKLSAGRQQSLRLADVAAVGPTRRNRAAAKKRQNGAKKMIQDFVGQMINCDTRAQRPFCSSSVTMPEFNPDDSFCYDSDEEFTEEFMMTPPPPTTMVRQISDNQPSIPLRRKTTKELKEADRRPKAAIRQCSVRSELTRSNHNKKRDSPPSPPSRSRPSLVDSIVAEDAIPSLPCRSRPSLTIEL
ncbi:expressed unknown protein [Seminavis robusta]|uniref:Uncharacterized protein n=1 Tax=Seminavis robusta TaxID=568900 RepID=A0A9N8E058_9STRA|nr:expressed unknown protein [Seminavis robusta]|eukprot:Sro418_g138920.1 n/a (211) ;mRNA; f:39440-40072